ncbi:MAG: L-seryl-tRNA(Sec) selenium transferase [Bryobacteraceae bacterium]|nr:L-seryl-tRNA(Sec) selenium transferase [Bryobacteraceae bacterium]MDW8378018.1 L-seryl-tRNA(Sec) selenium transferase [Bryobacterales bacterium]
MQEILRQLPSVDELLREVEPRMPDAPRILLRSVVRAAVAEARQRIRQGSSVERAAIIATIFKRVEELRRPSLRSVINATGVILHTNLGRAPLAELSPLGSYSNLEYDLESGQRGKRDVHCGPLFEMLLGRPAIVVNNNAAAVFLVLNELAAGAEVIVSRGQLIEIGDGFRIPDIMLRAGVTLREVGTTNRTRIEDYRNAISDRTRLILLVHPSNFRIEGFTAQPSRQEIVELAKQHGIPVYEDLGSGCLVDLKPFGIEEPSAVDCLSDGVNLVSFSGDKLLGGPQAGIIAGDGELVHRLRRNPMFRAFRVDKLILHALETTLRHYLWERWPEVPALRMIRLSAEEIRQRAQRLLDSLPGLNAKLVPAHSVIGGGSTPQQFLPTFRIAIGGPATTRWERQLRHGDPPVIAVTDGGLLMLDLRTVPEEDESALRQRLRELME